ncbi:MAG: ABC transporter ATP-binding protein [Acidiphilium sp. 37-67-22]|nr:MAG: ABC transporter ATP-binding protein [Acidiphilium sp. 37-67-22]
MSLLEIADLKVNYGQIEALKGVSLRVEQREIVAILGANGAGKTTLMRTISGLLSPRSGSVVFEGTDITRLGADRIVRLGIAQSPEGRRVFGTLSVMENLRLGAFTRPAGEVAGSLDFVLEMFPRLAERRGQLAGTMSGGEQHIFRTLREIANSGVTILIVEQNARSALKLADRGYVLEVGRFVIEDDAKTLLTSPEVQAAYLGGERKKT